jgi:tetratricopeptide (TPR) repeat protein
LKDFETVYSLDLNYSGIFYYLGMAKSNLGQIDAAIADFFKAIELGNRSVNIMKGISYAYLKAGKPDKALVYINIAL